MDCPLLGVFALSDAVLHRGRQHVDIFDGGRCQSEFRYVQQTVETEAEEKTKLRTKDLPSRLSRRDLPVSHWIVLVFQRCYHRQRGRGN